jgi:hypothetical protein
MDETIALAELIDFRDELPPIWVAYPGSGTFRLLIRPIAGRLQEIVHQATEPVWDEALMRKRPELNREKYLRLYGEAAIVDWQGLSADDLKRLVPIKEPGSLRRLGKRTIPFDAGARMLLLTRSPGFSAWLDRVVVDIELYNLEREEQAEKK